MSVVAAPSAAAVFRLRFARELSDEDAERVIDGVRSFEKDPRPVMGRRGRGPFAVRYKDEIRWTAVSFPESDRRLVMLRCAPLPGSTQYGTAVYVAAQAIAGKLKTDVDVVPEAGAKMDV